MEKFNQNYTFKIDKYLDTIRLLKGNYTTGDHGDYALTALYYLSGKSKKTMLTSLFSGSAKLINVEDHNKKPHTVLFLKNYGFICSNTRFWSTTLLYKPRYVYPVPLILLKWCLGSIIE